MFSPLQADSFAVTGSHGSLSSHLDYVESRYLSLERDLPEKLKKIHTAWMNSNELLFGNDIRPYLYSLSLLIILKERNPFLSGHWDKYSVDLFLPSKMGILVFHFSYKLWCLANVSYHAVIFNIFQLSLSFSWHSLPTMVITRNFTKLFFSAYFDFYAMNRTGNSSGIQTDLEKHQIPPTIAIAHRK